MLALPSPSPAPFNWTQQWTPLWWWPGCGGDQGHRELVTVAVWLCQTWLRGLPSFMRQPLILTLWAPLTLVTMSVRLLLLQILSHSLSPWAQEAVMCIQSLYKVSTTNKFISTNPQKKYTWFRLHFKGKNLHIQDFMQLQFPELQIRKYTISHLGCTLQTLIWFLIFMQLMINKDQDLHITLFLALFPGLALLPSVAVRKAVEGRACEWGYLICT